MKIKRTTLFFILLTAFCAVSAAAAPANDNLAAAQILAATKTGAVEGTNAGATAEAGEPAHFSPTAAQKSVWYAWTAPENGSMSFEVTDTFRSVIGIYKTSAAAPAFADLTNVANNGDVWGFTNSRYRATFYAESGKTYYIAVAAWGESENEGTFQLTYAPGKFRYSMKFHGFNQKTTVGVYRPESGEWWVNGSATPRRHGLTGDVPLAADYDGNGITDFITVRNENGHKIWYSNPSNFLGFYYTEIFGLATDKEMIGDFDRDGKADLVAIRTTPQNLVWYVRQSRDNSLRTFVWGIAFDKPVVGDFDGDGATDVAVMRNTQQGWVWYILNSGFETNEPSYSQYRIQQFGLAPDVPAVEDYDGDGKSDLAVWRPSNGVWYILRSANGAFQDTPFGSSGDRPVAADYDGDGKAELAVFRPSSGDWYFWYSGTDTQSSLHWGLGTDLPVSSLSRLSQ
jgi:hypothetical protein